MTIFLPIKAHPAWVVVSSPDHAWVPVDVFRCPTFVYGQPILDKHYQVLGSIVFLIFVGEPTILIGFS